MRRAAVALALIFVPAVANTGQADAAPAWSGPCHAAIDRHWKRDVAWAHAVSHRESRGLPGARNRSSGAAGCFQLMPQYYRRWMRSAGCSNVWDADCNVRTAWWLYSGAKQGRRPWRVR